MQKSKLYARTDYKSTIYTICMHQNLLFFMEKLPKMAVSWSIGILALDRQLQSPPPPPFLRVLIAQTQFTAFLCPKISQFSTKSAKNSHFFIKNCLFF